jgi:hypothetical protein
MKTQSYRFLKRTVKLQKRGSKNISMSKNVFLNKSTLAAFLQSDTQLGELEKKEE